MQFYGYFMIGRRLFNWLGLITALVLFFASASPALAGDSTAESSDLAGTQDTLLQVSGVCGDLNGDDAVNIFDAIIDLKIAAGSISSPTPEQLHLGNVARDSVINLADAGRILEHLLGISPITECGLPNEFAINIGDRVSDGVPGEGAGNLELEGTVDTYTFIADAGEVVFFDEQGSTDGGIRWVIEDEDGAVIVPENALTTSDPGEVTLERGGKYTITVFGIADAVGTYQFQIWDVPPPQQFEIEIGDVVSDGVPANGAGNIESPGSIDIYTFTANAGQDVYFDEQGVSGGGLRWMVEDSDGTIVVASNQIASSDPGQATLELGGEYTITVFAPADDIGTYQFQIWDIPAPQQFAINIGDAVSDGVPANGAGNIESPGAMDIYTFEGSAGQDVFFDEQVFLGGGRWTVEAPDGSAVFENEALSGSEVGLRTLPLSGTYTVTVLALDDNTGPYGFQIWDVPPPQQFEIEIGDAVSDGVPANGAGNIETPGVMDIYTFEANAGQDVFFDEQVLLGGGRWTVEASDGSVVFENEAISGSDAGLHTLTLGGTYTITVFALGDNTGDYGFQLIAQ